MARAPAWSAEEIQRLREEYSTATWAELIQTFRRTKPAVEQKANQLGLRRKSYADRWSEEHLRIMREQYAVTQVGEIATLVGRSYSAVSKKAQTLGLRRHERQGRRSPSMPWSSEEIEILSQLYHTAPVADLAERFGTSEQAVRQRAFNLGLRRPTNSGRHLPLGSERINEGVKERKVAATGKRSTDWKRVEVIEWEAKFGPVPPGHVLVVAKDEERRADNLTLMRIEDHPVSASSRLAPPEVRKLNNLKAQFTRQLNKLEKQHGPSLDGSAKAGTVWNSAEDSYLRANVGPKTYVAVAEVLQRTPKAVQGRAHRLGVTAIANGSGSGRPWTASELMLLKKMFTSTRVEVLAKRLGRSAQALRAKAAKLKLSRRHV